MRKSLSVLVLSLSVAACGGAENDPCQQRQDCSDGLLCCPASGPELTGTSSAFGTCRAVESCTTTEADAGADASADAAVDAAGDDASTDAAADADADAADGGTDAMVDASDL